MSLSELESPPDTEPGWKLDPLGVGTWRWWNGEKWLAEVAGESPARKSFADRFDELPLWGRFAIPIAGALIILLEYARWTGGSPLDLFWWPLPF